MGITRDEHGNAWKKNNPLPTSDINHSSTVTAVTAEAVSFIVASTNVADAGSAAGTVVYAVLANRHVLDSMKSLVGQGNDSSFSWTTGTVLTTMRPFPYQLWGQKNFDTRANKLAALGALLANGEYFIDHLSGLIVGKKATAGTSDTANYSYRKSASSSSSAASSSSVGGGASTFSNVQGDFTATANAGTKTITLSAYASTLLSASISALNFGNGVVKRISSAGAVDSLPMTNISFAANVLTLSDMTANFNAGDTVEVILTGPDKAYDKTLNSTFVEGNAASGAADSGNPVKMGGRYNAVLPTLADGQRGDLQLDQNSRLYVRTPDNPKDNAVFTPGSTPVLPVAFEVDDVATSNATEGNAGIARMTTDRMVYTNLGYLLFGEDTANNVIAMTKKFPNANTYTPTVVQSTALEATHVLKAGPGVFLGLQGRLDSTAPTGTYYVLVNNSVAAPSGAQVPLKAPEKIIHTQGVDDKFDINVTDLNGIYASTGIAIGLSTVDFAGTFTSGGAYLSITGYVI